MKICILEDDPKQRQKLQYCVADIIAEEGWKDAVIKAYPEPERLIKEIDATDIRHIYFLDIQIKNTQKQGLETAQAIRTADPYSTIVFITTHSEFLRLTFDYQVSAFDFIDKSLPPDLIRHQVKKCLVYACENRGGKEHKDMFILDTPRSGFQILFSDIYYFETSEDAHKVTLAAKNRRIEFTSRLNELEKLDTRLFRCHRSFLINPDNVIEIDKKENTVYFRDEERCFISRRKVKALLQLIGERKVAYSGGNQ